MLPATEPARPSFAAVLPRVSDFQRRLRAESDGGADSGSTLQASLDRSLLLDLQRFEAHASSGLDALQVMAASVRHSRPLRVLLQHEDVVLPLTVMPLQHVVHAPLPLPQWSLLRWSTLKVLQVEPAPQDEPPAAQDQMAPLGMVLWALALHGARAELLPEIAGHAAYRIAPGTDLSGLDLGGPLAAAMERLRRQTTPLRELSTWPGLSRERATRLLNGIYLQAGLIITRSHPAAG